MLTNFETIEGLGGKRAQVTIWPLELKFPQKLSTLAYKSAILESFVLLLRQMTEMTYFWPHSLTVSAPPPPPSPLCNVDLGLVLIARKLFPTSPSIALAIVINLNIV